MRHILQNKTIATFTMIVQPFDNQKAAPMVQPIESVAREQQRPFLRNLPMSYASSNRSIADSLDLKMLKAEHQTLENRLLELERHLALSPEEKYEVIFIKKRKLSVKDRMQSLEARN